MPAYLKIFIESASIFGDSIPVVIVTSLSLLAYFIVSGYVKEGALFLAGILSFFYSVLLKYIFKIPRLEEYPGNPDKLGDLYRFPSSHVIFYVVFWGLLLFFTFKKSVFPSQTIVWLIRIISIYHIILVGVSRILLGAHTGADVIAGYVFGAVYLAALIIISVTILK